MPYKGPHISIPPQRLIPRVLGLDYEEFKTWPESVQDLGLELAAELFMVRYNPFLDPDTVWESVQRTFGQETKALSREYAQALKDSLSAFWSDFKNDQEFREEIIKRLKDFLPRDCIDTRPNSRVECSTDATDLRMELPLFVLFPENTEQIRGIVRLANEMDFAIIPRGGGSGLTGGAIPGDRRSVVLSLARLKQVLSVDEKNKLLCLQSGVITLTGITAAAEKGLLFTVDPASKAASSIGGNVSENSGGPFAFEYGTTIDVIHSYRMVTPVGEVIEVKRRDHPRHKIMPEETAVFDILDEQGGVKETVSLPGGVVRGTGLGKDVTNKYLGGLPGVQKEGVDGIITEACFVIYDKPRLSRTLCLEFFGRSMRPAMLVIKDIVGLRDRIREEGDLVKISALEEFGIKYVQAIDYEKKSEQYEGPPISVLIVQLDSDDDNALNQAVENILDIARNYENVDVFAAGNDREAEIFWEDRHKLSAISKRTSGFKINEDIVLPLDAIPEFSDFLEEQNLFYTAKAYRTALQDLGRLPRFPVEDKSINKEFNLTSKVLQGDVTTAETSDQELEAQIRYYFLDLKHKYPELAKDLDEILERMMATRIIIANHMHAGDGNCHVNIPVNSNDPDMLFSAEEAVDKLFTRVHELGGEITGEHGVGITKIAYLADEKIAALKQYKEKADPKNILNPGKLTRRKLSVEPYTFSFNRLIQDIKRSGLADKHRLTQMLTNVQTCTRCGKCKQVCPMFDPQARLIFHPRNKNISLGALIEAIYYSQALTGEPDKGLLGKLRDLVEHCTACGKCHGVCPVRIDTADVTLHLRSFLEDKGAGGHPFKHMILGYISKNARKRLPGTAKVLSLGQNMGNRVVEKLPASWRERAVNPMFQGPGPELGFRNLSETLKLEGGPVFRPADSGAGQKGVLYFPGCGAGLFYRDIGLSALYLLIRSGASVVMPPEHLCCGYPLVASGCQEAFAVNREANIARLRDVLAEAAKAGIQVDTVLTSCGTCREGLSKYGLEGASFGMKHMDVNQFIIERLPQAPAGGGRLIYHAACHAEWSGVSSAKSGPVYAEALEKLTGAGVDLSPGCCGESGLGAMTSPDIYNRIRRRKKEQLIQDMNGYEAGRPIVAGCPSCKIGLTRTMLSLDSGREVLHTLEYLAGLYGGGEWRKDLLAGIAAPSKGEPRIVRLPEIETAKA